MGDFYDVVISGGGTVGIATALDAASRGLSVAVVEKRKIGEQTNNNSLGLIQRDPKYLHTDVDLVLMNAVDCGLFKEIAGDFLKRQKIIIPVFPDSKYPLWLWDGFLGALDKFACLSHSGMHERLSRARVLIEEPFLRKDVVGGVMYDEWRVNPLELTKAMAGGIVKFGGKIFENSKIISVRRNINVSSGKKIIEAVLIENADTKDREWIYGSYFVNATGPWAPNLPLLFGANSFKARLTRGTSIIVNKKLTRNAVILFNKQNKYITVMPYGDGTLIGPTNYDIDPEIANDPDKLKPEDFEIDELLEVANAFFNGRLKRENIVEIKCGLRPQPDHRGVKPDNIIHAFMIIDHNERDGVLNFGSMFGPKLSNQIRTTKEATDFVCKRLKEMGKLKHEKEWTIPNLRITRQGVKIYASCGQNCDKSHWYAKNYALSFKDKVGRVALFKRIKSLFFLAPFIGKGFLKEIKRRFKNGQ